MISFISVGGQVDNGGGQVQKQPTQSSAAQSRRRLSNDPRTCDECGRSFKYPSDLKKHLQIHTGFNPSFSSIFILLKTMKNLESKL